MRIKHLCKLEHRQQKGNRQTGRRRCRLLRLKENITTKRNGEEKPENDRDSKNEHMILKKLVCALCAVCVDARVEDTDFVHEVHAERSRQTA